MAKSNVSIKVPDEIIMNQIYYIRGQKVMLDRDLAELYNVTTGNLNKTVKNKTYATILLSQYKHREL